MRLGLRKYVSLALCAMQNTLSYRLSFTMNLISNFIALIGAYSLWKAVFAGQQELSGFTWDQMEAYLIVTFFVNSMLSYYSESSISGKVLDGSVMMDMLKPLDFQKARLAETLGSCILEGLLSAVLICCFAIATFGVPIPGDGWTIFLFAVSMLSSILVKFGIVYCSAMLCFWTTSGLGIIWSRMAVTNLLSGALVPLAFFPGWLEKLAMELPFQGIVNTPTMIYLDKVGPEEALQLIALQWGWIVVLWMIGKGMWTWAVRQITIHGG